MNDYSAVGGGLSLYDSFKRLFFYVNKVADNSTRLLREFADVDNAIPIPDGTPRDVRYARTWRRWTRKQQIAKRAVRERNEFLNNLRKWATPLGLAFSIAIKDRGLEYEQALMRYTMRIFRDHVRLQQMLPSGDVEAGMRGSLMGIWNALDLQGHQGALQVGPQQVAPLNQLVSIQDIAQRARNLDDRTLAQRLGGQMANTLVARVHGSEQLRRDIIQASGRTNPYVNLISKVMLYGSLGIMGLGGIATISYCAQEDPDPVSTFGFETIGLTPKSVIADGVGGVVVSLTAQSIIEGVSKCGIPCCNRNAIDWGRGKGFFIFIVDFIIVILVALFFGWVLRSMFDGLPTWMEEDTCWSFK